MNIAAKMRFILLLLVGMVLATVPISSQQNKAPCSVTIDCPNAITAKCQGGYCDHKDVMPPNYLEVFAILILPILLGLAFNGGIGGGGLTIPICIAMFGFSTIQAIAISNSTIFMGSAVRYFGFSVRQVHPDKKATMVDYNLASVMVPLVIFGSFFGTIVSSVLPDAVLTIIIAILMVYLTWDSFNKAFILWRKETKAMKEKHNNELPSNSLNFDREGQEEVVQDPQESPLRQEAVRLQLRDMSNLKTWRVHLLCGCTLSLAFIVNLVRGSKKNPSIVNMQKCSVLDWTIFTTFLVITALISLTQIRRIQTEEDIKKQANVGLCKSDISYRGKQIVQLALCSIGGGLASGVGLGGGIVFNPILIGMGVPPQVAASTGMYMIMFSAFLNTFTFWLFDNLPILYAFWIGFWSSIGIAVFLSVIGSVIKKYGRPSIIVFILGSVIGMSAVVVPIVNIRHLIKRTSLGFNVWAWGELC